MAGSFPTQEETGCTLFPGVNGKISDHFTARLSGQIPLYRDLTGTQLTTTYTASIGLFYSINLKDDQF